MSIRTVDYQSPDAGQEFVRSLHETGFAVLKNHRAITPPKSRRRQSVIRLRT
jgi:hypothetical protein